MKAIRLSRAVTGKKKIVLVSGSWHGTLDQCLFKLNSKKKRLESLSDGLDNDLKKKVIIIPYNNIDESKKILNKYKKKLAV